MAPRRRRLLSPGPRGRRRAPRADPDRGGMICSAAGTSAAEGEGPASSGLRQTRASRSALLAPGPAQLARPCGPEELARGVRSPPQVAPWMRRFRTAGAGAGGAAGGEGAGGAAAAAARGGAALTQRRAAAPTERAHPDGGRVGRGTAEAGRSWPGMAGHTKCGLTTLYLEINQLGNPICIDPQRTCGRSSRQTEPRGLSRSRSRRPSRRPSRRRAWPPS
jgi:hypothetical protein